LHGGYELNTTYAAVVEYAIPIAKYLEDFQTRHVKCPVRDEYFGSEKLYVEIS
jgi:hypothetical protein